MEYLDFSSVITTIRNYISDAHSMNQIDMMYQLFVSFLSSDESLDFDFDNGLVCRWFNGQAKISPRITRYYIDIVNIGLHFFLKNVRPYAASCSEA